MLNLQEFGLSNMNFLQNETTKNRANSPKRPIPAEAESDIESAPRAVQINQPD